MVRDRRVLAADVAFQSKLLLFFFFIFFFVNDGDDDDGDAGGLAVSTNGGVGNGRVGTRDACCSSVSFDDVIFDFFFFGDLGDFELLRTTLLSFRSLFS